MMKSNVNVSIKLNHFSYHNNEFDWTTEMPNFWFSFFKIDGSNCKLNDELQLEGKANIYSSFKKIESLRNIEPDRQDVLTVPNNLANEKVSLIPISVPQFAKSAEIGNFESYAGCIAVLMNDDCISNDEKNKYVSILNEIIQNSLDELIPLLNGQQNKIDKHLHDLKKLIKYKINQESRKNKSFWRRFRTENIIETTIWIFSSEELKSLQSISLTKYWGIEGVWKLSGKIKIQDNIINQRNAIELKFSQKQKFLIL